MPGWLRNRAVVDALVALGLLVLAALYLPALDALSSGSDFGFPLVAAFAAIVPGCLAVGLRRRFPLAVLGVVTVAYLVYGAFLVPDGFVMPAVFFLAMVSAGSLGVRPAATFARAGAVGAVGALAVWQLVTQEIPEELPASAVHLVTAVTVLLNVAYFAVAWVVGDTLRLRRLRETELAERNAALAAANDEIARRAVIEERVRIARELHDVVAHHVSLIGVQAAGARRVLDRRPDAAKDALQVIEDASRGAVAELHRLLGMLRTAEAHSETDERGAPLGGADDPLAPQPTISRIDTLLDAVRNAAIDVVLRVEGDARTVPPAVDLSAYRVVQEALTNVVKHAGDGARAEVTLAWRSDRLEVLVVDDGTGRPPSLTAPPTHRGGGGITGMRERLALLGGVFQAGPRAGGGFEVRASFPLEGA